jgi:hypothetical protein
MTRPFTDWARLFSQPAASTPAPSLINVVRDGAGLALDGAHRKKLSNVGSPQAGKLRRSNTATDFTLPYGPLVSAQPVVPSGRNASRAGIFAITVR